MRYAHALLMNSEFGIMDGLVPDALSKCPQLFKANTHDPDTSYIYGSYVWPF